MQTDIRGLPLTTDSEAAARALDDGITAYLDYRTAASAHLKAALDADPGFVMARCVRGYFMMMLEMKAVLPKVRQSIEEMRPSLAGVTARERGHVAALSAWADGDIMGACAHWEDVLAQAPRDLLAMKLHHTMAFYTGRSQVMRQVLGEALGAWNEKVPGYGYVEGMYAYALEECGDYAQAEKCGRSAVARNPGDLWAIHSVAHVLEMQGRSKEGIAWLPYSREEWTGKNPFKAHVWWHGALFRLAQRRYDEVLGIYDDVLKSVNTDSYVDVSNQAALLKRLQMCGVDVGDRWHALADFSATRMHDHMLPFRDAHFCLALAADGRIDEARTHVQSMTNMAASEKGWRATATRDVLIPLCEGMIAYEAGDYDRACDLVWPIRHDVVAIGGSHAQRDLFAQILADAAANGSRKTVARGLYSERVLSHGSRAESWRRYARVLDEIGDTSGAAHAARRAEAAPEPGA